MNKKLVFIGIDPGSVRLGYAILFLYDGIVSLNKSGVMVFHKKDSLGKKLRYVFDYFKSIVLGYLSEGFDVYFSIEKQYYDRNVQSVFVLVSFYSVFLLLSELLSIHCFDVYPSQIKKIISGYGSCTKEELFFTIEKQFNISLSVYSLDESDAIAIALGGLYLYRNSTQE